MVPAPWVRNNNEAKVIPVVLRKIAKLCALIYLELMIHILPFERVYQTLKSIIYPDKSTLLKANT